MRKRHLPSAKAGERSQMITDKDVYAVILVGGVGKRLRPLSTEERPKAFLSVTGDGKTMFASTLGRISRIVPLDRIMVVANKRHVKLIRRDFPSIARKNLILEPASRNTAPAIALAASALSKRRKESVLAVIPTDQYIVGIDSYIDALERAIEFIKEHKDRMMVIGIRPDSPATGFGYIKTSGCGHCADNVFKVERFVEKPDAATARGYLKSGMYLWNSGAFVFRANTILNAIRNCYPEIIYALKNSTDINRSYAVMPDISIDYAVMERAGNLFCVKGVYGWMDMGNFENLKKILRREGRKFRSEDGKITEIL